MLVLPLPLHNHILKKSPIIGLFFFCSIICHADLSYSITQDLSFSKILFSRVVSLVQVVVKPDGTSYVEGPIYLDADPKQAIVRIYGPVGEEIEVYPTFGATYTLGSNNLIVDSFMTNWPNNICIVNSSGWCDVNIGATLSVYNGVRGNFSSALMLNLRSIGNVAS